MRRTHFCLFPVAWLAGFVMIACSGKEEAAEAPVIPSVMVMASDYAFQMPDTLGSGVTSFRLMNHGQELHHLSLIKLAEGMTVADIANLAPTAPMPEGMVLLGGPNPASPGGAAEAIVDLTPGRYVALCAIPSPDGQPHMAKGMMKEFTVTASQSAAVAPTPDVTVKLTDFAFTVTPELSAGHHVIRVENTGSQWHEFVFVKLEAGKSIGDFAQWAEKVQGPPPATPMNGVAALGPGQSNTISVDLVPGDYGFVCFLPDLKSADRKPHLMLGMMQQVKVM